MADSSRDTQERLLTATLALLRSEGIAAATSRQIAAAAGVNLQAITYHFGSKDELVAAALVAAVRSWVSPARNALQGLASDPAGRLLSAIATLRATLDEVSALVPAYLQALALLPQREQLREQINALQRELRDDLARSISELRSAGLVAAWVEPEPMAALIVAAADGLAIHSTVDPVAIDLDAVLAQAVGLLLAAAQLPPGALGETG